MTSTGQRCILLTLLALTGSLFSPLVWAQDPKTTYSTLEAAQADPDFAVQGEYVTPDQAPQKKGIQVVALGKGQFRVVVYTGGLPGAGWDQKLPQIIEEEETEAVADLLESLNVAKTSRTSSTLETPPPTGAVVLFDGQQSTLDKQWKPGAKMTPDGLLQAGATTAENFRDYTLHVEFRNPFMPFARGQARGNSGVYHQGRYETQILDSFGLKGLNNETGGIYTVRDPDQNLCLPPLAWQTYDIDFTAARFDAEGKKLSDARLTVRLNGEVVQRDIPVPDPTRAAPLKETAERGPIYLQDHGNPVQFRNIWLLPRDADLEARRPRIPGYERFHALSKHSTDGGLLLLGELGCINCHAPSETLKANLLPKTAPILTEVGARVRPEWIASFLTDPHGFKPGTTMPDVMAGWNAADRAAAAQALAQFLSTKGALRERNPDAKFVTAGEKLFGSVGCVACHAPADGKNVPVATSVPLGDLAAKYSIPSLTQFLKDPRATRPSARMPSLHLEKDQPEQVAHYLLRQGLDTLTPNVRYKVYEGRWSELPNFDELKPVKEGLCVGFDLTVAGKTDNFGIRFEAFLPDEQRGAYVFGLGSDDGARLYLDGDLVLDTDGIHPVQMQERTARFEEQPWHTIRVDYFEATGDEDLVVMMGKQGAALEYLAPLLLPTAGTAQAKSPTNTPDQRPRFTPDPALVARGRELFTSIGCANCHELKEKDQRLKSTLAAKPFDKLDAQAGCLADSTSGKTPDFALTNGQRRDIELALLTSAETSAPSPQQIIDRTFTAFNCYACHERQGIGGPEASRNELFLSTQPEMGDEGRIPPSLNGVGDKLQDAWLKTVLDKGARNRPYMLTRMPAFGGKNVGHVADALISLDQKHDAHLATFTEPPLRVKSTGRQLVGNGGLGCIKCHTFGDKKSTGIQAISLTGMTSRLRSDWFLRYVFNPQQYRPGTRMPTGFPDGHAVVKDVFHGDPNQQISAIWMYLSDGDKAGLPDGLVAQMIELKPEQEPIIYRNFIEGVSPRAIAVGYPEKVNLAWDANELCLKLIWHDRFLDAALHWTGRGTGNQTPLGDHILTLEPAIPFATLATPDAPWPTASIRSQTGYRFEGYQLDAKGRPVFSYQTPFGSVTDFPEPIRRDAHEGTINRVLTFQPQKSTEPVYFRAAVGSKIEPVADGYLVNDALTMKITGGDKPLLRKSGDQMELLVPIPQQPTTLTQEISW
ncbi:family 16 glycoside hydrolase [Planctomicrobium piriforme]|uniref:PA14 domain-containing protein n=1 Tax=Planctomicrobium piriforme TaxID=1576369 RepID=A0A1I3C4S6_9PLAN|nr:family 16 glycoside hydrolase [Planctomicrobium piriforme]SFH69537.1 PA14 domain-containing protein [Planctomicrobium piriforme]